MNSKRYQNGSVLVSILIVMLFLISIVFALMIYANSNLFRARGRIFNLQAQYSAESGADQAIAILNGGNESYTGTTSDVSLLTVGNLYRSTYSIQVAAGATLKEKKITAVGKVYVPANSATPSHTRTIEITAERTSSSTASSMLSKNIIEVASSVKQLRAKDVFVNNYIKLNKNTNELYFEKITVADRETSAANCSIGGSGKLFKASSLGASQPAQITTAFNNCLTPPGNSTTNPDFTVLANQNNIAKVSSINIPWSQYMDNSYNNATNGCADWTSGGSTRDIPSTNNTKKTHYPDSSSGIASSCGTSGNIALGSNTYNILDNAHLRANLCVPSACTPTFNNPDSSIKFVFIEGRVNFDRLTTSNGSGPIVFVIYGADSGSRTNACPLGDSFYLGKDGGNETKAPAIYALTNNGACLDGTKFEDVASFGGIAAKNIYIATNSGNPFDLAFDITFPTNSIPIDLQWKATRYRRL